LQYAAAARSRYASVIACLPPLLLLASLCAAVGAFPRSGAANIAPRKTQLPASLPLSASLLQPPS
jgi:hypothetical protein